MTMTTTIARHAVAREDAALRRALAEADLPVADLDESNGRFYRFEKNGVPVGVGGYEPYGADALLRSVAVDGAARGTGAGRVIVEALLDDMRQAGVTHAYLLTTTAAGFFRHLGFAETARDGAPDAILSTPQATSICSSAALLRKAL
jgi:N-acetylglutamate synthase-like GNAT family acetyltransferase